MWDHQGKEGVTGACIRWALSTTEQRTRSEVGEEQPIRKHASPRFLTTGGRSPDAVHRALTRDRPAVDRVGGMLLSRNLASTVPGTSRAMTSKTDYERATQLLEADLGDELVALDTEGGNCFGFNPAAALGFKLRELSRQLSNMRA